MGQQYCQLITSFSNRWIYTETSAKTLYRKETYSRLDYQLTVAALKYFMDPSNEKAR